MFYNISFVSIFVKMYLYFCSAILSYKFAWQFCSNEIVL